MAVVCTECGRAPRRADDRIGTTCGDALHVRDGSITVTKHGVRWRRPLFIQCYGTLLEEGTDRRLNRMQAARLAKVQPTTIDAWRRSGLLTSKGIGQQRTYSEAAVTRMRRSNRGAKPHGRLF